MALQKDIVLNTGVTVSYHRINSITETQVDVLSYLNQQARLDGKSAIQSVSYAIPSFTEDELKVQGNSPKVLAYTYLKTLEGFSGSTDI